MCLLLKHHDMLSCVFMLLIPLCSPHCDSVICLYMETFASLTYSYFSVQEHSLVINYCGTQSKENICISRSLCSLKDASLQNHS